MRMITDTSPCVLLSVSSNLLYGELFRWSPPKYCYHCTWPKSAFDDFEVEKEALALLV